MTDEDGNPIDVAPHAQMKVRLYMDTKLEPYSMNAPRVQGESRVIWYMKILLQCLYMMK